MTWSPDPTFPDPNQPAADHDGWRTLSRELQYDGDYVKLYHEIVATPTRPGGQDWTVVRRKAAVVIAARTEEGKWLLVCQERIAIRQTIWEFPAGQIEVPGNFSGDYQALLEDTVWRELREETGYMAGPESSLTALGLFFSSAGFTDEHSYIFLADKVVPHAEGSQPDQAEAITGCRAFLLAELHAMVALGEIFDANTLASYARLAATRLI